VLNIQLSHLIDDKKCFEVIKKSSLVYTDEYDICDRLPEWGYPHKSVNHSAGEYARDEG